MDIPQRAHSTFTHFLAFGDMDGGLDGVVDDVVDRDEDVVGEGLGVRLGEVEVVMDGLRLTEGVDVAEALVEVLGMVDELTVKEGLGDVVMDELTEGVVDGEDVADGEVVREALALMDGVGE